MNHGADARRGGSGGALGIDVGATLAKLAIRDARGRTALRLVAAGALDEIAGEVEASGCARVGLTGGGAPELAARLPVASERVDEFEAWGLGARELLRRDGHTVSGAYLLVSLGTGCSALRVDGAAVARVGGTALGGGTIVGLGQALIGTADFAELAALAREGDRRHVDLLVSDIYRTGAPPLPGDLNAASFAKLARGAAQSARAEDLAHALMGLVGENVGLIVAGLAAAAGVRHVVFGGTTLRENPALVEILRAVVAVASRQSVFLRDGEFTGAIGALRAVTPVVGD